MYRAASCVSREKVEAATDKPCPGRVAYCSPVRRLALVLITVAALQPAPCAAADAPPVLRPGTMYAVPLYGTLVRPFDAPLDNPYAPGHRGDDVAAPLGTPVHASADGVVSFAGNVAGNLTVSVDHAEGVRTSYSYLGAIAAKKGQHVTRGDVIGTVGRGDDATLPPNVHLSARRNGVYFDPLELYVGDGYADLIELVG